MPKPLKQVLIGIAALAALALGGSAIATATTGSSSAGSSTTPSTTTAQGGPPGAPGFTPANAPGTAAHESAEKTITGEAAEKARAAALASTGGGKATSVTGDFRNSGAYEVAVTKTDGSQVVVHLDSSFKVQSRPPGPGMGGPGHAPPNGQAPPYGQAPPGA